MTIETLIEAAEHWEKIADANEQRAAWDRDHGIDLSSPGQSAGDYRAARARRCAKTLRLEAETGRAHCTECLGDHPNHLHPHIG